MTFALAANLLTIVCLVALATSVVVQRRRDAVSAARIARLEDVLTRLTREELRAGARLSRVERTLKDTRARQDSLASRAHAGPRIESAVRVARQGSASEDMLRELGLSAAEASLLLRLHAGDEDAVADGQGNLVALKSDKGSALEDRDSAPQGRIDSQAATLTRLLAEKAAVQA